MGVPSTTLGDKAPFHRQLFFVPLWSHDFYPSAGFPWRLNSSIVALTVMAKAV
jgi:hypothetical protein